MRDHPDWSELSLRDVALLLRVRPWFREAQLEKDIKKIELRWKCLDNRQPQVTSSRNVQIKETVAKAMSDSEKQVWLMGIGVLALR